MLYCALLPGTARGAFIETYGPVSDDDLLRARTLAFGLSAVLAAYAHREGHAALERESLAALDRAATG